MVLFREFFTGSIHIIQGGKLLSPVTNNAHVRGVWQGRKRLGWMLLELISLMTGRQTSVVYPFLASSLHKLP